MNTSNSIPVRVSEIQDLTPSIKKIKVVSVSGHELPSFSPGSHILVTMRNGSKTYRNPYSLVSPFTQRNYYEIAVRRAETSRGGSAFLHAQVTVGTELEIGSPLNLFPLHSQARKFVLVAGGIGITPIISYLFYLDQMKANFEIHYAIRNHKEGAFVDFLEANYSDRLHLYCSDEGRLIEPSQLLSRQPLGTHLSICGPSSLMNAVVDAALSCGWPENAIHLERFAAQRDGNPFDVVLTVSSRKIHIPAEMSLLEALENSGLEIPNSCRGGVCGLCETEVLSGEVDHRDHFLDEVTKCSHRKMMPCVSRARGEMLQLNI